jgi:hypothetical protein
MYTHLSKCKNDLKKKPALFKPKVGQQQIVPGITDL